ncbi:MAG: hypothetical protein ACK559_09140, partial [bacterium]
MFVEEWVGGRGRAYTITARFTSRRSAERGIHGGFMNTIHAISSCSTPRGILLLSLLLVAGCRGIG